MDETGRGSAISTPEAETIKMAILFTGLILLITLLAARPAR